MSRGNPLCDVCRKPCQEIVGKMFLTFFGDGSRSAHVHSRYQHHLDIGDCCGLAENGRKPKILLLFLWTERVSAQVYRARKRLNGPRTSVEKE